ncbi:MAG: OmpP1/FadL family transporter [Vicinamibacteria bacterium]
MVSGSRRSARFAVLAGLGLVLAPIPARAAGFALFEEGARGMGFAGAYTAQAADPSAIFHNAAGIAFLKGKQIYIGGTLINPATDFTGDAPFPGAGQLETMNVGVTPIPAVYYTHQLSESFVAGIGLDTPFGLKTEWDSPQTFTGRFLSQKAELKGFSLNPTVAFKLADRLSLGVGLDVRFSSVTLDRNVPLVNPFTQKVVDVASVELKSDTATDFGWNLGVLAKPTENLSIGVSYRRSVKQDYAGTADFNRIPTGNAQLDTLVAVKVPAGPLPAATFIEYPSILSLGVAYSWKDWTVEGDVNFYGWSSFASLPITIQGRPDLSAVVTEDFQDSRQYRIGLERQLNDAWAVRGGYFHDESPSPPESVSPLLPDANRNGFCAGASWKQGHLRLDGSVWYVHLSDRSTEGVQRDSYNGTYSGHALTLGLALGYSF